VILGWHQQHCRQEAATFAVAALVQKPVTDMLKQTCNKRKKRKNNQLEASAAVLAKCSDWCNHTDISLKRTINHGRCSHTRAVVWHWH